MLALTAACTHQAQLPAQSTALDTQADIFPDYRDIVIPANIAPLNFMVKDSGAVTAVAQLKGANGQEVLAQADRNMTVRIDTAAWKGLLQENRGKDISVTVYVQNTDGWIQHKPHTLRKTSTPI